MIARESKHKDVQGQGSDYREKNPDPQRVPATASDMTMADNIKDRLAASRGTFECLSLNRISAFTVPLEESVRLFMAYCPSNSVKARFILARCKSL